MVVMGPCGDLMVRITLMKVVPTHEPQVIAIYILGTLCLILCFKAHLFK